MLKNLSDYLSFMTLIFFVVVALRIFLVFILNRQIESQSLNRINLIRDYINNDEE